MGQGHGDCRDVVGALHVARSSRAVGSKVGMFPVAGVGAVVYLALTAVALTICVNGPSRALQGTVLCLSLMQSEWRLWFIVVQALVVRRFCIYCNLVHIFGAVGCTLTMSAIHPSVELMFAVGVSLEPGVVLADCRSVRFTVS